ncbi:gamma-glutamylcyclotransferase [Anaeromyxobacter terrae]|uniref:gamma-glutamylcyclotransferase n=1 Tax=Anaeromyxobacter terrae TaxID=2925406 RepID=UPI001F566A69|nr:gamma-glutamylcyclotransferase [Anaeromyxobacter sp. SG22]
MPGASRGLADHKEGAVSGLYEAFEVQLSPVGGGPHIPAIAYRAANSRRLANDAPPSPAYLEVLLRGARARGLSEDWIRRLEALAATPRGAPPIDRSHPRSPAGQRVRARRRRAAADDGEVRERRELAGAHGQVARPAPGDPERERDAHEERARVERDARELRPEHARAERAAHLREHELVEELGGEEGAAGHEREARVEGGGDERPGQRGEPDLAADLLLGVVADDERRAHEQRREREHAAPRRVDRREHDEGRVHRDDGDDVEERAHRGPSESGREVYPETGPSHDAVTSPR